MNPDPDGSTLPPDQDIPHAMNDDLEAGPRAGSIRSASDVEDTIGDEFQFMNTSEPEPESLLPAIILMGKRRLISKYLHFFYYSVLLFFNVGVAKLFCFHFFNVGVAKLLS